MPPLVFLASVLVVKAGHAAALVLLFRLGGRASAERWLTYAVVWWLMFVVGEVGQAIGPSYSWEDAIAGVISETIYFPVAGFVTQRLLRALERATAKPILALRLSPEGRIDGFPATSGRTARRRIPS